VLLYSFDTNAHLHTHNQDFERTRDETSVDTIHEHSQDGGHKSNQFTSQNQFLPLQPQIDGHENIWISKPARLSRGRGIFAVYVMSNEFRNQNLQHVERCSGYLKPSSRRWHHSNFFTYIRSVVLLIFLSITFES
jgi:hypothetical protein